MSISYSKVESSTLLDKASCDCRRDFVQVKVNPTAADQFPFPSSFHYPRCFLPNKYISMSDGIRNFEIRSDDIWITSFPKSGTTWVMNIGWQLLNNLNFSAEYLNDEYMYFERAMLVTASDDGANNLKTVTELDKQIEMMADFPSPRLMKSHLPAHLLPFDIWKVRPKMIYVYRDAKDVAISMYHMYRNHARIQFTGTMEDYFDAFLNDYVTFGPFYEHINSYRQLAELDNVLLLSYEDLIANSFAGVKKINDFLNCKYSDEQLNQLADHVSFGNMRKNLNVNLKVYPNGFNFFRKGKSGGYKEEMSPDYVRKFDEWKQRQEMRCSL